MSLAALIRDMAAAGAPIDAIVMAVEAVEHRSASRASDEHTARRDSNRSRRGMPDQAWRHLREIVFARDNHECQYCWSRHDLTCDHIVPLIRGGDNHIDNLATACRSCNSSKGDKLISEWEPR